MRELKEKPTFVSGQDKSFYESLTKKGFKIANAFDLSQIKTQWLIEDFLLKRSLVMIYAEAGSGKSYFALYLANFLLESGKISMLYYLDADNDEMTLKERKGEIFLEKLPNLKYIFANNPNKYTIFKDFLAFDGLENSLIIIDSIRNFIQDDLNKDRAMIKFFDDLQRLRGKGATIIFLHHQPKQTQDENNKLYKGSTAFLDSVDEGYFLCKKEHKENEFMILLEPQKQRYNTKHQAFKLDTQNLSLEKISFLEVATSHKEEITINLVKDILAEFKALSQQNLAKELKKRVEQDFVEIVGRNALWKLLDKYKGILWKINFENTYRGGGKRKIFTLK